MKYKMRKYLNGQAKDLHMWRVKQLMEDEEETIRIMQEYTPVFMNNIIDPDYKQEGFDKYINSLRDGRFGDFSNRYIILAYDGDCPIGMILALPMEERSAYHIIIMAIKEEYRGKGVASRLMATCINDMFIGGVHELILDVYAYNMPAVNLYKKFGFERIDKDYYPNNEAAEI